jgi:antirestriction protein ArdC
MRDVYQSVTDKIVAQLEAGTRPWAPSWTGGGCLPPLPIRSNGKPYRGVNILLLWSAMVERGYTQRRFVTFKQALDLGGNVRKGEKSTPVVYFGVTEKEDDSGEAREVRFLKTYAAFNVEQCEGLPGDLFDAAPVDHPAPVRIERAEAFFAAVGASVEHGGNRAFYMPSQDRIQLPPFETFHDAEAYYATRAHETVHWTGHETRCARTFGKRFKDDAYAAEELVAEMGAAFLCADLGLAAEPREDHAAYLDAWLKVLKADKRAIFTAASAAQAACDFIHNAAAHSCAMAA